MQKKRFLAAVLTLALTLAVFCPVSLASSSFGVKINSSSARVYAKPSSSASSIPGKLGAKLSCVGFSDGWACVKYKSNYGFMKVKYLNLTNRITAYTKQSAKIYSKASSSSNSVSVAIGTTLYVNGYDSGYARVQNKSGSITGYIKSSLLTTDSNYKKYAKQAAEATKAASIVTPESGTPTKAEQLIAVAVSYLGTPYGSGAPSKFNCSSFVRYCYKQIGYSLEGSAKTQAADSSMALVTSISSLKMGDVLCFDTDGDGVCDHTAIYISGSDFIEASQNAGCVQINELDSFYKKAFLWARRIK